jgi:hypothetical protein
MKVIVYTSSNTVYFISFLIWFVNCVISTTIPVILDRGLRVWERICFGHTTKTIQGKKVSRNIR